MTKISASVSRRHLVLGAAGFLLVRLSVQTALAAPQTFLIFFSKQSAELVPSARPILEAIKTFIKPNTRVTISGHCDTSESDPDRLSNERANAVQSALVDFITVTKPQGVIFVFSGKGTSEQHVATGPNVSEPQNRYVSITIE